MKEDRLFFNPFRMLSPKLHREAIRIEELPDKPVADGIPLEEGLLIMTGKLIEMARLVSKSLATGSAAQMEKCEALADEVHQQEKFLTRDLVGSEANRAVVDTLIRFPYRLERIGDMLESILRCSRKKAKEGIPFSEKAFGELDKLFALINEMLVDLRDAIRTPNKKILEAIRSEGRDLAILFEECKIAHWRRLEAGFCAVEASSLYRDILDSVRTIGEYLSKMSESLLELDKQEIENKDLEKAS